MAPSQTTTTPPLTSPEPESSTLPGLKRGIAVGVASSVCLILVALLVFVLRRRKKRKQQQRHANELPAWAEVKAAPPPLAKIWIPIPSSPIEADTGTIYELDASEIPELPTRVHTSGTQELHADSAGDSLADLKMQIAAMLESAGRPEACERRHSQVPALRISAPQLSPLSSTSGPGWSPVAVSPLEEAYVPQSPLSPLRWP